MGTPHNEAEKGEIAKRVLMPGDPLRAKYIAEHFLEDAVCFNTVRNMLGYTGTYKGEKISVMGGGMGVPSVGIYTYELYHEYEVEEIIRIGSAGALQDDVDLRDVVIRHRAGAARAARPRDPHHASHAVQRRARRRSVRLSEGSEKAVDRIQLSISH